MKKVLTAIFIILNCITIFANEVVIKDENKAIKIGKNISIYEDKTGKLNLEDILKKTDKFCLLGRKIFNSGYSYSTFWFTGKIKNMTENSKFILKGLQGSYEAPTFYYSTNEGNFIQAKRSKKEEVIFKIKAPKGSSLQIFLKVKGTGSFIRTDLCLLSQETYNLQMKDRLSFSSANFILEIIFGILSIFMFFMFKQKLQLYYLVYTVLALALLSLGKYENELLRFLNEFLNNSTNLIVFIFGALRILCAVYFIKFIKEILGLRKIKYFNYCAYFLINIMALCYILPAVGLLNFQIIIFTKNLVYLLLSILYLLTSILWFKRNNIAKFLIFAFVLNFLQNGIITLELFTKKAFVPISLDAINFWLLNFRDIFLIFVAYFFMKSNSLRSQEALVKSSKNLVSALRFAPDLDKVLASLLNSFRENVNYDKGYVYLFKNYKYELASSTLENVDAEEAAILAEFLGDTVWTSEDIIDDAPIDKRFEGKKLNKIESILVLPIKYDGEYYGAILITSHYRYMYTYESINYGVDLVQKTAIVLDSFNKLSRMNELLNLAEVEKLSRRLLESSNHELKSPVLAIKYFVKKAEVALNKFNKEKKHEELIEVFEDLNTIEEGADEALKSILEAMALAGGEIDVEFPMSDLSNMMQKFAATSKDYYDIDTKLDLNVPGDMMLMGPKIGLVNAVSSMIKNSIEAFYKHDMQEGQAKIIKMTTDIRDDKLYIEIYDNGKGIKKENQSKVFGLFSEGKTMGTGKGLMFAKVVMDRLGSKIYLESEEGKFTKFYFTIDVIKGKKEKHSEDEIE